MSPADPPLDLPKGYHDEGPDELEDAPRPRPADPGAAKVLLRAGIATIVLAATLFAAERLVASDDTDGNGAVTGAVASASPNVTGSVVSPSGSPARTTPPPSPTGAPGSTGSGGSGGTGGKPSEANTGVPPGTTLKRHNGSLTITKSGTVVDALDVTGGIEVRASNVTIKRTRVRCKGQHNCILVAAVGTVISDTDIGGGDNGSTNTGAGIGIAVPANKGSGATVTQIIRVNIHHTADGLRSDGNLTVRDSYIHHPDLSPGNHGDGSQTTGWSNMVFRHNVIIGGMNAAIYLSREPGNPAITNVVIDDNWLGGSWLNSRDYTSFPLYVNGGTSGVVVTNNRFNRIGYAPAADRIPGGIVVWRNNVYEDTGQQIGSP